MTSRQPQSYTRSIKEFSLTIERLFMDSLHRVQETKARVPGSPAPAGSSLPTSRVRIRANPEGILQQSPGLRATSYPGSTESRRTNPNGVVCLGGERGHNLVGVETRFARYPRVARRLATPGWRTQSLWDCLQGHPGLVGNDKPPGEEREATLQTHSRRIWLAAAAVQYPSNPMPGFSCL